MELEITIELNGDLKLINRKLVDAGTTREAWAAALVWRSTTNNAFALKVAVSCCKISLAATLESALAGEAGEVESAKATKTTKA